MKILIVCLLIISTSIQRGHCTFYDLLRWIAMNDFKSKLNNNNNLLNRPGHVLHVVYCS